MTRKLFLKGISLNELKKKDSTVLLYLAPGLENMTLPKSHIILPFNLNLLDVAHLLITHSLQIITML